MHAGKLNFLLVIGSLALAGQERASQVALTVDAGRVVGQIDKKVYGQFFEHIYHSANGGLWGDMVFNRSFEETDGTGQWSVRENVLGNDAAPAPGSRMYLGDSSLRDYEFSFDAMLEGPGQLTLFFRASSSSSRADDQNAYAFRWGASGSSKLTLVRFRRRTPEEALAAYDAGLEIQTWHKVRLRCEGNRFRVWLDEKPLADFADAKDPALQGRVGIGSSDARAQFRDLKISSLAGKVMFQRMPSPARHWFFYGKGGAAADSEHAFNSKASLRLTGPEGESGVVQDELALTGGDRVRGSLWARGASSQGMVVRLLDAGKVLIETSLPSPASEWKEYPFEFTPGATVKHASIQVGVKGRADVWLDQVSLMADSSRATGGFRPDLLKAVADIQPPIIRWPGGSFVGNYRWKDAIGPQTKRGTYPSAVWDDKDSNSLGTDEFMQLCRKVGAEPLIVINIGYRDTTTPRADYIQEALDWMEYVNGPADSKWGKVRAGNGHPQPYNVKYWEIANETWSMGPEAYIQAIRDFVPPMRQKYPSVKIAVCGGSGTDPGNRANWDETILKSDVVRLFDYLSIHHYETADRFAEGPLVFEKHFAYLEGLIHASANPKVTLYVSEWNAQTTDWRTGLYAGGLLNAFERSAGVLEIGGPALFLRHATATGWDNAFINFDQTGWFPAPNYVVMKLWREHYAPALLTVTGDAKGLNLTATKSGKGDQVFLKAVNPTNDPAIVKVDLKGVVKPSRPTMQLVAPGSLDSRNTLEHPAAVAVKPGRAALEANTVSFTMPPLSAGVVTIDVGR